MRPISTPRSPEEANIVSIGITAEVATEGERSLITTPTAKSRPQGVKGEREGYWCIYLVIYPRPMRGTGLVRRWSMQARVAR